MTVDEIFFSNMSTKTNIKKPGEKITIDRATFAITLAELDPVDVAAMNKFADLITSNAWTLTEAAKRLGRGRGGAGFSPSVLSRVFAGNYPAKLDNIVLAVREFVEFEAKRATFRRADFVETSLTRHIAKITDQATTYQSYAFLFGQNQIGKTRALEKAVERCESGRAVYCRIPAAAGKILFLRVLAEACGVPSTGNFERLRARVLRNLSSAVLVVFDEMHLLFSTCRRDIAIQVIEFIREIHDRTSIGVVLCGTDVFRTEMKTGQSSKLLRQSLNRGLLEVQLDPLPSEEDLALFADAFGLPEPSGRHRQLRDDLVSEYGLGKFLKHLEAASRLAHKRSQTLAWSHVGDAAAVLAKLAKKSSDDKS